VQFPKPANQAYNSKQRRDEEKVLVEQAERAYEVLAAHWQPRKPTTQPNSP
jgi:transposase